MGATLGRFRLDGLPVGAGIEGWGSPSHCGTPSPPASGPTTGTAGASWRWSQNTSTSDRCRAGWSPAVSTLEPLPNTRAPIGRARDPDHGGRQAEPEQCCGQPDRRVVGESFLGPRPPRAPTVPHTGHDCTEGYQGTGDEDECLGSAIAGAAQPARGVGAGSGWDHRVEATTSSARSRSGLPARCENRRRSVYASCWLTPLRSMSTPSAKAMISRVANASRCRWASWPSETSAPASFRMAEASVANTEASSCSLAAKAARVRE